jgi:uncharacterized protein (TIGR00369 family)
MTGFIVRNPSFREDIARSFARQGALLFIGAELDEVDVGRCVLRLPIGERVLQQQGFVHGGMVGLIGDVAGGYAAMSLFDPGCDILTVEYKINFLAPAGGDALVAEGRVLRSGRKLTVTTAEVRTVGSGRDRVCAVLQQTCTPS